MVIDRHWVEEIRASVPELAPQKNARFIEQYGLGEYDARLLTGSKDMADYFEAALSQRQPVSPGTDELDEKQFAKAVSNWMLGDLSRLIEPGELRDHSDQGHPRTFSRSGWPGPRRVHQLDDGQDRTGGGLCRRRLPG